MTHRVYDDRDDPKNLSTSVATQAYQNSVQLDDVVRCFEEQVNKSITGVDLSPPPLGVVIRVAGQDDGEFLDDSVPEGNAKVWFIPSTAKFNAYNVEGIAPPEKMSRDDACIRVVKIEHLEVLDRTFCRSSAVCPYPTEAEKEKEKGKKKDGFNSLRQGIICDSDLHLTVKLPGVAKAAKIHSSQLSKLHPRSTGAFTARLDVLKDLTDGKTPLERLQKIKSRIDGGGPADLSRLALCCHQGAHFDLVIHFPQDASVCVVFFSTIETFMDEAFKDGADADHAARFSSTIDIFYPSQNLTAPRFFKQHAIYLRGKNRPSHKRGVVLRVVPYMLQANLLVAPEPLLEELAANKQHLRLKAMRDMLAQERSFNKKKEVTEGEGEEGEEEEEYDEEEEEEEVDAPLSKREQRRRRAEEMDEHAFEGAEDEDETLRFGIHPALTHPLTCYLHGSCQFGDVGIVSQQVLNEAFESNDAVVDVSRPQETPESSARLYPSVPGSGILLGREEVEKYNSVFELAQRRASEYRKLIGQRPVQQLLEAERQRTVLVIGTERRVKVQWQDGTISDWIPAKDVFTLLHTQAFDHFPFDFVTPSAVSVLGYLRDNPEKRTNAAHSCYDVEGAWNGSDFGVGDLVMWCPRSHETERKWRLRRHGHAEGAYKGAPRPAVRPWVCSRCTLLNACGLVCRACGLIKVMSDTPSPESSLVKGMEAAQAAHTARYSNGAEAPAPLTVMQLITCGGVHVRVTPFSTVADEERKNGQTPKPTPPGGVLGVVKRVNTATRVAHIDWVTMDEADEPTESHAAASLAQTLSTMGSTTLDVSVYEPTNGAMNLVDPADTARERGAQMGVAADEAATLVEQLHDAMRQSASAAAKQMEAAAWTSAGEASAAAIAADREGEGRYGMLSSDAQLLAASLDPAHAPPLHGDEDRTTFLTPADYVLAGVVTKVSEGAKLTVKWYEWDKSFYEDDVDIADCIFIDYSDMEEEYEEEDEEDEEGDEAPALEAAETTEATTAEPTNETEDTEVKVKVEVKPEPEPEPEPEPTPTEEATTNITKEVTAVEPEEKKEEEEEEEDDDEDGECPFQVINEFTDHLYLAQAADAVNMRRVKSEWKSFHRSLPPGIKVCHFTPLPLCDQHHCPHLTTLFHGVCFLLHFSYFHSPPHRL